MINKINHIITFSSKYKIENPQDFLKHPELQDSLADKITLMTTKDGLYFKTKSGNKRFERFLLEVLKSKGIHLKKLN